MAIFLTKDNKVIVQGITGAEATVHTARMLKAGTQIVGGVNARKAGTTVSHKDADDNDIELPVFGTVVEAIEKTGADVSIVFVPPRFAKDAVIEAIDAEIPLLVVITEGIPVQDTAYAWAYNLSKGGDSGAASDGGAADSAPRTRIIGPNCPGIITPGESLVGITPANISGPGPIGLVSKSGTLTYQMMFELRDFGFSTSIGIGGDPVIGTTHIDAIEAFEKDPDTKVIVMIGEIGGDAEERAADYIKANVSKPVVGYVAGFTAPEGKTMGHAGAIVSGSSGTAQAKKEALEAAGVKVGKTPSETAALAREILQSL
jgi:succinyl-CoA synthetase alpha subunit